MRLRPKPCRQFEEKAENTIVLRRPITTVGRLVSRFCGQMSRCGVILGWVKFKTERLNFPTFGHLYFAKNVKNVSFFKEKRSKDMFLRTKTCRQVKTAEN